MYAALIQLTIDQTQAQAAAATFTSEVLPRVTSASGFIAGYWVDPVDSKGFGFILFDTKEEALAATPPATAWSAPGVEIQGVDVRRVAVAIPNQAAGLER